MHAPLHKDVSLGLTFTFLVAGGAHDSDLDQGPTRTLPASTSLHTGLRC